MGQLDWRVRENSNTTFAYPGLVGHVANHAMAEYMLQKVYTQEIAEAHRSTDIHIHDLSGMNCYCMGLALDELLHSGVNDIDGPPKHFSSAMSQMMNTIYLVAQEIAGAVAFNTVDILMAAYIRKDKLSYEQVKQTVQEFVCSVNIKGRIGHQTPFLNFQLDATVPKRLRGLNPIIADEVMPYTYDDLTAEIEMFNTALFETIMEAPRVLSFPVINIGITRNFDWDSKLADTIFRSIGETGQPTINNYYSGNYDPDAVKSMCCSLRLDMSKLITQAGGQFGAADNSGSIGVVTLNLPIYAYRASKCSTNFDVRKQILLDEIDKYLDISFKALILKRKQVEDLHKMGMYPTVKRFVYDFRNFFSTIGIIGLNEMCLNMGLPDISNKESSDFCKEVLNHINEKLSLFQVQSAGFYGPNSSLIANLELIPGEGVTHRFAKHAKKKYSDMIVANGKSDALYLTRGCWLPIDKKFPLWFAAKHQEEIQCLFSGGANFQHHTMERMTPGAAKSIIHKLVTQTTLPFISISPMIEQCPVCGKTHTADGYCLHNLHHEKIDKLREKGVQVLNGSEG